MFLIDDMSTLTDGPMVLQTYIDRQYTPFEPEGLFASTESYKSVIWLEFEFRDFLQWEVTMGGQSQQIVQLQ